ncbi:hypothetical protein GXN76_04425 [Kroppenstedtia pulmonis]|uniref:Putative glycogen debranching enzyme N-terminal domain-containing protein n=1 Tax=Kroppenstedtia pulmonis TaxID=1380685 RepID=A0A7D4BGS1_9BACL|nr:hypothetical protein GXN76_04425 [Kroppenstedtia pulmonis]
MPRSSDGRWGLYWKDTRFLNQLQWSLKDTRLQCLSANMKDGIYFYHYTHDKGIQTDGEPLERDTVEIIRKQWIKEAGELIRNILGSGGRVSSIFTLPFRMGLIICLCAL